MTVSQDQATATNRLRRALLTFQSGQTLFLKAHRQMKGRTAGEVETFWAGSGARLEQHAQTTAAELVEAFRMFSKAGLVADAEDRHLITEAQRYLAEGSA
jgi:hypothetical protein